MVYGQGGHLVPYYRSFIKNLAFIEKAVSEKKIFEYHSNIHVYCPAMGTNVFQNHKSSVSLPISFNIFPSNDILTIFTIEMHG